MKKYYAVISGLILCLFAMLVASGGVAAAGGVEERPRSGVNGPLADSTQEAQPNERKPRQTWYFGVNPPKEEPRKPEAPEAEQAKAPTYLQKDYDPHYPTLAQWTEEQLMDMPAKPFNELREAIMDKATTKRDEVAAYESLIIQKIAFKRARIYTDTAMYVTKKYPELNEEGFMPNTPEGVHVRATLMEGELTRELHASAGDFELLVFYSPECGYCADLIPVVQKFIRDYGWNATYINVQEDPETVYRLRVEKVPFVSLIYRYDHEKWWPLVNGGTVAEDRLRQNIYRGIKFLRGEMKPEEWSLWPSEKGGFTDPAKQIYIRDVKAMEQEAAKTAKGGGK